MSKELDKMTPEELGKLFPIILSEPKEDWPVLFMKEKKSLEKLLGKKNINRIEHIGSTAIPGIMAKPTIDILLEIFESAETGKIIEILKNHGYHYIEHKENPPPHMLFVKGYTPEGFKGQAFHVHVRYPGDWDEIYFRDYLQTHPEDARDYERLKIKLSKRFKNDRDGYTENKTGFIKKITGFARKKI
ncbi:MAG: GrpB family protein [bacterium]|nr:GrpB family protein [bacterium]